MALHPLARTPPARLLGAAQTLAIIACRLPSACSPRRSRNRARAENCCREPNVAALEAALLLADEPLSARKLAALAGLANAAEARRLTVVLRNFYERGGSSFQLEELAGGYQLLTKPEYHQWLARLRRQATDAQLSAPARETLAIIAYRQPVTRTDIEAIRGVGSSEVLRQLMEKALVRLAGRDDSLGRPALYETTKKFLQMFGLKNLKDLPDAEGLRPPKPEKTIVAGSSA